MKHAKSGGLYLTKKEVDMFVDWYEHLTQLVDNMGKTLNATSIKQLDEIKAKQEHIKLTRLEPHLEKEFPEEIKMIRTFYFAHPELFEKSRHLNKTSY